MKEGQNRLWIWRPAVAIGLVFAIGIMSAGTTPSIVGDWQGTATWFSAENGNRQLQIIVHISQAADGALAGTLGFPDMGSETVPLSAISYEQPAVHFEFQFGTRKGKDRNGGAPAKYDGTMSKDNSKITGAIDPGQGKIALVLKRVN